MVTSREIGQLYLNGEKIMEASVAPHSNFFPSFGPNECREEYLWINLLLCSRATSDLPHATSAIFQIARKAVSHLGLSTVSDLCQQLRVTPESILIATW